MNPTLFPPSTKQYHTCQAKLVKSGAEFFNRLIELIHSAKATIHIQVYIFGDDQTGHRIAAALLQAAANGVQIYLLADGYASDLSKGFIQQMTAGGIHFRYFEPIFRSDHFYFGRRLHHKIVVVDARTALVGGINLADRYNDIGTEKTWLDMALEVSGAAAQELHEVCTELWQKKLFTKPKRKRALPNSLEKRGNINDCLVRIRRNDWVKAKEQIWRTYAQLFRKSQNELTIMCSYFLPGRVYQNILKKAVQRGVKVRVILAGLSDVKMAKHAERYLYRWMLRNGLEIYEYQPAVLHAKVAVADGTWLTVGSYNINDISAYASIELNLEVKNQKLGNQLQRTLEEIIEKDCLHITSEKTVRLFSWPHLVQLFSFYAIRVLLKLSTFYFKRHE